jgi:mono/diheme cytochrome c family protein
MKRLFFGASGSLICALALTALAAPDGRASDPAARAQAIPAGPTAEQAAFFESKIRPLLAKSCFSCHGDQQQRGGLRLDSRESLVHGGGRGPAVDLTNPSASRIIAAIRYDGQLRMPPSGMLRADEIAALTAWIKQGAPWPAAVPVTGGAANGQALDMKLTAAQRGFWSFQPVVKPALPAVRNKAWCVSPIDRFVLAKLNANGMKPAPPADRRTLIRRVTFDLIGLPPTPEEVDAFVADRSPHAWEKVVDRLLASPHYGERWGRHWLDLVRYADSNGLDENVAFANAFRYRDYVVRSFNADKPYSEFVREQLAGDLMPGGDEATRNDRLTATGFLSLGPKLLAEPDKPKMVMDIVDEQIEVTSKAFLGLTVTCARCHNHKFDPIPTKDYYALAGIFKSTKTMATLNTVAMWQERPLQSKLSETEATSFQARIKRAQAALDQAKASANAALFTELRDRRDKYLQAAWELLQQGEPISVAEAPARPGDPPRTFIEAVKFNRGDIGRDADNYGKGIGGIILNVGGANQVEWDVDVATAGDYQLEVRYASAEARPVRLLLNGALIRSDAAKQNTGSFFPDGQRWEVVGRYPLKAGRNVLRLEAIGVPPHISRFLFVPVKPRPGAAPVRTAAEIAAKHGVIVGLLRYVTRFVAPVRQNPSSLAAADLAEEVRLFWDRISLPLNAEPLYADSMRRQVARAQKALSDLRESESKPPMVMAVEDTKAENCRVHIRGDTQNLGDEVPRHFLTVLGGDTKVISDSNHSGRLELADWIVRPDHPLTSRVEVNRIWQNHFGTGIVQTPDNWGFLGARPTSPQLLDWLAATFVEQGWSIKKLHRIILLSNTYKMGTVADPKTESIASKTDPDDALLWKMPRRRLEAEPFRDALLSVSGKLDLSVGGSLLTTRDHDYVTNDQSGNAANYNAPRRSIYLPIIRNALFDMFQAFDYGDPSMVNARRSTTTVAPQALYVMNSPFVLDQARAFAANLLARTQVNDADRLKAAYMRAYSRPPTAAETGKGLGYIAAYSARLAGTVPDAGRRREQAWASFCQLLFASNEFIYVN